MQNIHFLKKSKNKNLIRYLLDFFTLEEKIQKMKINRIFFKSLNDQIVFKELRILNIELRRYKELVIGILLDNNSEILMKILKTFKLSIKDDILVNWVGRWINKFYLESKFNINLGGKDNSKVLNLRKEDIGDLGTKIISEAIKNNKNLLCLNFQHNTTESNGIKSLLSTLESNNTLLELDLSYSKLNDFSIQSIAFSLSKLRSLAKLCFCSCQLGDNGIRVIFEGLKLNTSIREVDLALNNLTYIGAIYISETLKVNKIIQKLNLYWNKIGSEGARYISASNGNFLELNLADNDINADGVKALADNLAFNDSLISLNLHRNNDYKSSFSFYVAQFLSITLSLEKIDLGNNFIGYDGIKAIFLALKNNSKTKLNEISLESNEIDCRAIVLISEYLVHDINITCLNLTNNYVGPEGAQGLSSALKTNKSLKFLYLANNRLGQEGTTYLSQCLRFNKSLITIDLGKNNIERNNLIEIESAISKNDHISLQNIIVNEKNIEPKMLMNIQTLLKKKRRPIS